MSVNRFFLYALLPLMVLAGAVLGALAYADPPAAEARGRQLYSEVKK